MVTSEILDVDRASKELAAYHDGRHIGTAGSLSTLNGCGYPRPVGQAESNSIDFDPDCLTLSVGQCVEIEEAAADLAHTLYDEPHLFTTKEAAGRLLDALREAGFSVGQDESNEEETQC